MVGARWAAVRRTPHGVVRPRRARTALLAAPAACMALLVACAGSSKSTPTPSSAAPPASAPTTTTAHASITPPTPGEGVAAQLQQEFITVVDRVRPSVVEISTEAGLGSGVVFDAKGDVVTNAHVV